MKINCTIDNKSISLTVNSNKPLNLILMEDVEAPNMDARCRDGFCGNCVVLLNDEAVLSCLIPAFKLKGARVLTFDGFKRTRFWHDLERAYEDTGSHPCPHCYASKTLIFEALLQTIVKSDEGPSRDEEPSEETIVEEIALNRCPCLDAHEMIDIFKAAATYRRRRRVRRY
jgi:carbon-monoxide dehydrogenase small subunit